jgi:hypothetical protein
LAVAGWFVEWPDGEERPGTAGSRSQPPQFDEVEPDASERITLIEFLWTGPTGEQPVILVSREWLQ